ncbi:Uncharacterised protein [Mycoplasmopsis caviae]|uniref:Uncharacterized protein n=1 Tax=Mycoplasmopsis caviae TaxID=55603 RepID=A0A3P8KLR9_9BACT|nr:Uncharacterised protein [Mycoplasmopsis caviae]
MYYFYMKGTMIPPQNIKQRGSKKRNKVLFWILISLSIFLCFILLFIGTYFLLLKTFSNINDNEDFVKVTIQKKKTK